MGRGRGNKGGEEGDLAAKKGGTNGIAVRAGRPVTQTTSGFGGMNQIPPQPE